MDSYRFAKAYAPLPEKIPPSNKERRELLAAPRKWMHFFDETMDTYLSGGEAPNQDHFYQQLYDYYEWNREAFTPTVKQINKIDNPDIRHNNVIAELGFHQLNGPMAYLWHQLLYKPGEGANPDYLKNMQLRLAMRAAPIVRHLVQLQSSKDTVETQAHKMAKGTASEIDTAITGLEIMKTHPEIIFLPAPARYENNPQSFHQNADMLMIDTVEKQARGIQIKTDSVRGAGRGKIYDKDYVSVVDGAHELGNSTYSSDNKDGVISLPGQIAMGILADQPLREVPKYTTSAEFMRTRQIAREIIKTRRSYLAQATLNLSGRLIPDLHRQPVEILETPETSEAPETNDKIA